MTEPMNPDYKPGNPQFDTDERMVWDDNAVWELRDAYEAMRRQAYYWMSQAQTKTDKPDFPLGVIRANSKGVEYVHTIYFESAEHRDDFVDFVNGKYTED